MVTIMTLIIASVVKGGREQQQFAGGLKRTPEFAHLRLPGGRAAET